MCVCGEGGRGPIEQQQQQQQIDDGMPGPAMNANFVWRYQIWVFGKGLSGDHGQGKILLPVYKEEESTLLPYVFADRQHSDKLMGANRGAFGASYKVKIDSTMNMWRTLDTR